MVFIGQMKSAANRKKEVAMKHLTNVKNFFLQDEEENNRDRASEEKSLLNNSDSPVVNKPQTRKKRSDVDDALKMLRERPTEYSDSEPESSDSDDGFANGDFVFSFSNRKLFFFELESIILRVEITGYGTTQVNFCFVLTHKSNFKQKCLPEQFF